MEKYLMYLRKSQMDRDFDDVSVEETLNRHRKILTDFCRKKKINVDQILEEVVSGESLTGRPKMLQLLELINTGSYSGVVCMDIDRLSRGSSFDSGYIMQILQINNCKILTPSKIYDLSNESDEQFTDMKFMFSRYELKTITKRLCRGRDQSASEGKFMGSQSPYGYEIYKLQGIKGNSLRIIDEEAEIVKMIFKMYADGIGYNTIAYNLSNMHIKPRSGKDWSQTTIVNILNNEVYLGLIRWKKEPTQKTIQNGTVKKKRIQNKNYELHQGLHEPIIDQELWDKCKEIQGTRYHTSNQIGKSLQNPFADILKCGKCGSSMKRNVPAKDQRTTPWFRCSNRQCDCRSIKCTIVEDEVYDQMQEWLSGYKITIQLDQDPKQDNEEKALSIVRSDLVTAQEQQNKICDLLEKGVYSLDLFTKRNTALQIQIDKLKCDEEDLIKKIKKKNKTKNEIIIPTTQKLLDSYEILNPEEKNKLWKEVLEKVTVYRKNDDIFIEIYPKVPKVEEL